MTEIAILKLISVLTEEICDYHFSRFCFLSLTPIPRFLPVVPPLARPRRSPTRRRGRSSPWWLRSAINCVFIPVLRGISRAIGFLRYANDCRSKLFNWGTTDK